MKTMYGVMNDVLFLQDDGGLSIHRVLLVMMMLEMMLGCANRNGLL